MSNFKIKWRLSDPDSGIFSNNKFIHDNGRVSNRLMKFSSNSTIAWGIDELEEVEYGIDKKIYNVSFCGVNVDYNGPAIGKTF